MAADGPAVRRLRPGHDPRIRGGRTAPPDLHHRPAEIALRGSLLPCHRPDRHPRHRHGKQPLRRILQPTCHRRCERRPCDCGRIRRGGECLPSGRRAGRLLQRADALRLRRQNRIGKGSGRESLHPARRSGQTPAAQRATGGADNSPARQNRQTDPGGCRHLRAHRRCTLRPTRRVVRLRPRNGTLRHHRTDPRGCRRQHAGGPDPGQLRHRLFFSLGSGSLCGIIGYFNGSFSLRITGIETSFVTPPATPATAYP